MRPFVKTFCGQRHFSTSLVIQYEDLKNGKNLENAIESAYGPKGLGILFVDGVLDFPQMRTATLPLLSKLGQLPSQTLKKYMRPEVFHSLGWSCGVQQFQGKYDTSKGSFYFNAKRDHPQPIAPSNEKYYTEDQKKILLAPNKWVDQLPLLEKNVKALAQKMMSVGSLLAQQIDAYAAKNVKNYEKDHLFKVISTGTNHVGRLLHYFPFQEKDETNIEADDWCGWHNDHGSLTALTPAMFCDKQGKQFKIDTQKGGLYAKNRFAEMTRVKIPPTMLGFQLGESMQIKSGSHLEATPHCVVKNPELIGKNVARNTFALFMEPNHLQIMKVPDGITPDRVTENKQYKIPQLKDRWTNGMYFKDFHRKTIEYYS